jgi:hypothetical protein
MLVCNKTLLQYIGSSTQQLEDRLQRHESAYKSFLKGIANNCTSFKIIENNDYYIQLIEEIEINTRQELYEIEAIYIKNVECINERLPKINTNRVDIYKAYYQNNKDKIREKARVKVNCICGVTYSRASKARHEKSITHQNYINLKTTIA